MDLQRAILLPVFRMEFGRQENREKTSSNAIVTEKSWVPSGNGDCGEEVLANMAFTP